MSNFHSFAQLNGDRLNINLVNKLTILTIYKTSTSLISSEYDVSQILGWSTTSRLINESNYGLIKI
ncbi:MAG: hypothetical protein RMY35_024290 [Nostoc sp. DedSLP01]|nr:hypothetical protein [Nostoc sp. DedSLP05]